MHRIKPHYENKSIWILQFLLRITLLMSGFCVYLAFVYYLFDLNDFRPQYIQWILVTWKIALIFTSVLSITSLILLLSFLFFVKLKNSLTHIILKGLLLLGNFAVSLSFFFFVSLLLTIWTF